MLSCFVVVITAIVFTYLHVADIPVFFFFLLDDRPRSQSIDLNCGWLYLSLVMLSSAVVKQSQEFQQSKELKIQILFVFKYMYKSKYAVKINAEKST